MKRTSGLVLIFMIICLYAKAGTILETNFSYKRETNDFTFYLASDFSLGYGGGCPHAKWFLAEKSNDTLYIKALYDIGGAWPAVGCSSKDTLHYTNPFSGINYVTVSCGKVIGFIDTGTDTTWNIYDSTFDLNATGINETIAGNAIGIYPNPATNTLNIPNLAGNQWQEAVLYNSMGQIVMRYKSTKAATEQLNISNLAAGLYQLVLFDDKHNKLGSTQFVKQTE